MVDGPTDRELLDISLSVIGRRGHGSVEHLGLDSMHSVCHGIRGFSI
jgi:hypothetical protein